MRRVCIDFETFAIEDRPAYPPEPVGVALKLDDGASSYMAWGHPTGNNCTREEALEVLWALWTDNNVDLLFHNAKFDLAVAHERLGLPLPLWWRVHDTMFLLFLLDPHARSLSLKAAAEQWLGVPPDEQATLHAWLWERRDLLGRETGKHVVKSQLGAWIAYAPGNIVEPYARGDVERTWRLFHHLNPLVAGAGMLSAYARERRILPMLLENERDGVRVDLERLGEDVEVYRKAFTVAEEALRRRLGAPGLNLDADRQLAEALSAAGVVDDDKWVLTPSGQRSVSKENLTVEMFSDPHVAAVLGYRNRLQTCLKMFMEPWLRQGSARGGVISTTWNQVRGEGAGTRTGRLSASNPNLLNLAKDMSEKNDGYAHPAFLGLPELPLVRRYVLPDEGGLFLHRDFDGQELRVFAGYEQGPLRAAYLADPALDPHGFVGAKLAEMTERELTRTQIKILNFQALYGGGVPAAAKKLQCSLAEAKVYKQFHDRALPGRKLLNDEIMRVVRAGDPVRTWGGRCYYPEAPSVVNGRRQTWEYKLINYVVQGSAADVTKELMAQWYYHPDRQGRFLVQVYDEFNVSAPEGVAGAEMALIKGLMDGFDVGVPMRSSGKIGRSWGEMEKCA